MRAVTRIAGLTLLLLSTACASSGEYMGIDIRTPQVREQVDPARALADRKRNLLMLIAMVEGCYERVPRGFRPVQVVEAKSFECAEKLAAIENLSDELGLGRGPSGIASMSLTSLARMASAGSKNAQLELGIRFEEGIGVSRDFDKARKLYGKAATTTGGTLWVYSPPVGNGTSGRVIPIDRGPRQPGLQEATQRLQALDRRLAIAD